MALVDVLQELFHEWDWTVHTLPDRQWKWRSRLSGLQFSQMIDTAERYDLVLTGSLTPLTELLALAPQLQSAHKIVYFHENQFHYPFRTEITDSEKQIMYNSVTTALAADSALFNSEFNRGTFLTGAELFLNQLPVKLDTPRVMADLTTKSAVFPIPLALEPDVSQPRNNPPVILWNHRWEHDKQPELFFEALFQLAESGSAFRLIVAGEEFDRTPEIFQTARNALATQIIHFGFAKSRDEYQALLAQTDIVVSTAAQEFYGLSVLEAVAHGAIPVVPDALSYQELFPEEFRYPTSASQSFTKALQKRIRQGCDNNLPDRKEIAALVAGNLMCGNAERWRARFLEVGQVPVFGA